MSRNSKMNGDVAVTSEIFPDKVTPFRMHTYLYGKENQVEINPIPFDSNASR